MIRGFADFAANERTYLAWVRTGIAIVALGFVFERFNLFLLALAAGWGTGQTIPGFHTLASPAGRYGGLALVGAGVALIAIATIRFLQIARLLADEGTHWPRWTQATLFLLSAMVLAVAAFSAYLAIG